ncbi:Uncharacterized protein FWK35_00010257 [Aphis craccivora]|uniref:Uncharacterized protein n=1 Tax=Aphis craccivora TaxID=307492 RepID=A0A6G0YSI1_APHCR|nr:Uncharacterized protein FWK35_00010257 [Aphis craccivora]
MFMSVDKCIDFTVVNDMCFVCVCVCVYSIACRINASISNFGGISLVHFTEVISKHFPIIFKTIEENIKKVTEKREFLRKTSFRLNRFFLYGCNSKTNHYLKFSPKFILVCPKKLEILLKKNSKNVSLNPFYKQIFQNLENLQNKEFNTMVFISFPSNSYRENSKHHYRRNVMCYLRVENLIQVLLIIIIKLKFWCIRAIKT